MAASRASSERAARRARSHRRQPARATDPRGQGRRADILSALHDCVIDQGYAKTTLADIARKAGMSPSHLLYYFRGKDAILDAYFKEVAERILRRIDEFRTAPLERQIDRLSALFFAGKGLTRFEIGFMLECFGAAVHDQQLHHLKAGLDRNCKKYLRQLFGATVNRERAADYAEIAYALLIGLRTAAYFDSRLGLPEALRLFRAEMRTLAGLARRNG
jgi:AcrR family transcriptional regulator